MSRVTVNIEYRIRKDKKTKGIILVIYSGYTKDANGIIKPKRKKETLDYLDIPLKLTPLRHFKMTPHK